LLKDISDSEIKLKKIFGREKKDYLKNGTDAFNSDIRGRVLLFTSSTSVPEKIGADAISGDAGGRFHCFPLQVSAPEN